MAGGGDLALGVYFCPRSLYNSLYHVFKEYKLIDFDSFAY